MPRLAMLVLYEPDVCGAARHEMICFHRVLLRLRPASITHASIYMLAQACGPCECTSGDDIFCNVRDVHDSTACISIQFLSKSSSSEVLLFFLHSVHHA
jgi:hypothetical protein